MNTAGGPLISTRGMNNSQRRNIQRRAAAGELMRLENGVYLRTSEFASEGEPSFAQLLATSAVARPNGIVIGRTAARVYGLAEVTRWRRETRREPIELGHLGRFEKAESWIGVQAVHHRRLVAVPEGSIRVLAWRYGQIRVSSVAETCAQLARWHSVDECVVAAEDALIRGKVSMSELRRALSRQCKGKQRAMVAHNLITGGSDSPRESELKLEMWRAGIPAPHQQVSIFRADGEFLGRVDFLFECGVIVEYDGEGKHDPEIHGVPGDLAGQQSIRAERQRERLITNEGFVFIRIDRVSFRDGSGIRALQAQLAHAARNPRDTNGCRIDALCKAWLEPDRGFVKARGV